MPTSKKRITITVTGQIERDLDIIWNRYPNLRDNAIETIAFVLTLKASEIATGQVSTPRTQQTIISSATDETQVVAAPEIEVATDGDSKEWSD